jgi:methionine sulfoxide reductase heme-binding subunit
VTRRLLGFIKTLVLLACLIPLVHLLTRANGLGDLGANPIQEVLHTLGKTSLNLILITLVITPLRRETGLNWLIGLRRILGLLGFFYVLLHASTYIALDQGFAWNSLLVDVTQRPYITLGFLGLLLMVPLALTSTNSAQRRLGRRWTKLHRLIYLIAVLGVLHFFFQVKIDISEPVFYSIVLLLLIGYRINIWLTRRRAIRKTRTP